MKPCTDETKGHLITFYEMNALSEEENILFEDHLLECDFCRGELTALNTAYSVIAENKSLISRELSKEGVSFSANKQTLISSLKDAIAEEKLHLYDRIRFFLKDVFTTKGIVPAMAVTCALILLLILPKNPQQANPYLPALSFEKSLYRSVQVRTAEEPEFQDLFNRGMQCYQEDEFESAIPLLEKAVTGDPDNGTYLLYLGICNYLDRNPSPAIEALIRAELRTPPAQRNRARWYLAQSYLLAGNHTEAVKILELLTEQQLEYAEEAETLLMKIDDLKP
ncbi:hypothetical protein CEE37_09405 [candidate division LCP-89 bacterium B3_LCP]|uniref:Uncharacterized protein n=1 Tax=candidate division LCP-89 bacterium B3_LCP TaxID=2012998 RepID=A0A532UYC9_UNCL8|nr:MAG: hypothetical protein CEE37_09405 [candidate division LCP-89 bacterium B3_LCP]